jgi:hypothetical protein
MPRIDPTLYCSIQTGARLAGVSRLHLRQLIKANRLPGIEIDGYYFAVRAACEKFERDPTGRGRPRTRPADGKG